ncbi:MAG: Lrp/AsnC family transcriptional regulator [Nitriliruptor sp.]|nr:MAG: Lrp/AsnC family transcriptional regulator [Nitriliruptor sp.]
MRLNDIDRQIVAHLQRDARASYRAIGDAVGLSAPAVKRRVDRLVDAGVIEGFTAVTDPRALGWGVEAFIAVYCEGRTIPHRIRTAAAKHPEVVAAYTVTGDHDALLHVRVRDTAHLEDVLERLRTEEFIAHTRSLVVLSRLLEREVALDRDPATEAGP